MIGALPAPDRLGLLDSRAAAHYECDARPSTCPLHDRACSPTIAHYRWWHSVACTECHRRESRMVACHTETCEVRRGICRRSRRRHVSGKVPGRDGGERACGRRRSDTGTRIRAAWPVAERYRGAVSGRCRQSRKSASERKSKSTFCYANESYTRATSQNGTIRTAIKKLH